LGPLNSTQFMSASSYMGATQHTQEGPPRLNIQPRRSSQEPTFNAGNHTFRPGPTRVFDLNLDDSPWMGPVVNGTLYPKERIVSSRVTSYKSHSSRIHESHSSRFSSYSGCSPPEFPPSISTACSSSFESENRTWVNQRASGLPSLEKAPLQHVLGSPSGSLLSSKRSPHTASKNAVNIPIIDLTPVSGAQATKAPPVVEARISDTPPQPRRRPSVHQRMVRRLSHMQDRFFTKKR
jgi:hypothetical protein